MIEQDGVARLDRYVLTVRMLMHLKKEHPTPVKAWEEIRPFINNDQMEELVDVARFIRRLARSALERSEPEAASDYWTMITWLESILDQGHKARAKPRLRVIIGGIDRG